MMHVLKTPTGEKLTIEMGCNHPDMKSNNAASVGCSGNCSECSHSIATTSIPEMLMLLELAGMR